MSIARLVLFVVAASACGGGYTAGDSMVPSIEIGARVELKDLADAPARGRVVVFRAPEAPDRRYIKRVIGIAGDTIAMNGAEIVLNGAPVPRCDVGAWSYTDADGKTHTGEIFLEALASEAWLVFHDAAASVQPTGPWTVAPGEVFVIGNNRDNSHDSRVWFGGKGGGLPLHFIVGVAPRAAPTLPRGAEALAPSLRACTLQRGRVTP